MPRGCARSRSDGGLVREQIHCFLFHNRTCGHHCRSILGVGHPDPVVEIRLLADRNFAIANFYYFLFGFALFGSTVLIPQMLQSLYGYTATDAGLVLGPGAFVIVALAPLVVRILPKVGIKPMIFTGYIIFAFAMWHFVSFNLGTDYRHIAFARALQGLGIAPLFVPVSQLAYSFLPKNKNNKASSLTNLFRNQGASG